MSKLALKILVIVLRHLTNISTLENLDQCVQTSAKDISDSFDTLDHDYHFGNVQTSAKDISDSFDTLVQFVKYLFTASLDTLAHLFMGQCVQTSAKHITYSFDTLAQFV